MSIAIEGASLLYLFEPLVLLKSVSRFSAQDAGQLQTLAYAPLRLQSAGYDLALVFFGIFCIAIGALIWQSAFLPRVLGVLMAVAGLCYPINSFVHFLAPQHSLFPYILLPCFLGELALCLWLMARGVNLATWEGTLSTAWRRLIARVGSPVRLQIFVNMIVNPLHATWRKFDPQ